MVHARLYAVEAGDVRQAIRRNVERDATVRSPSHAAPIDVDLLDLSVTGFRVQSSVPLPVGSDIRIGIAGTGIHWARVVRKVDNHYGCSFHQPLPSDSLPSPSTVVTPTFEDASITRKETKLSTKHRTMTIVGISILLWAALSALLIAVID